MASQSRAHQAWNGRSPINIIHSIDQMPLNILLLHEMQIQMQVHETR